MSTIEKSIEVNVPVRTAYNQWTQFEEFPRFMEGVQEVKQLDNTHLHWKAQIAGKDKEWNAVITEQRPDERIAWKSTDGAKNAGVVTFHRLSPTKSPKSCCKWTMTRKGRWKTWAMRSGSCRFAWQAT